MKIFVVEWKVKGQWEPTLEVAFILDDIKPKLNRLKTAHGNKYRMFRVESYERTKTAIR